MAQIIPPKMIEATQLTLRGKLAEATELIQRVLRRDHGANLPGPTTLQSDSAAPLAADPQPAAAARREMNTTGLGETLRDLLAKTKNRSLDGKVGRGPGPSWESVPDGASFALAQYSNEAGTRPYKLYVPSGRDGHRLPLVVMLHGCTQSADDFAAGTQMNNRAEEEGFLVVYPEQSSSANTSKCWNWFNPKDQRRDQGELAIIAGITRQIMIDHAVDGSRVYIAGLSAGGAAAILVAAAYPDIFAAVGVHSGLAIGAACDVPSAFAAMREGASGSGRLGVPTIVFHGNQDTTVHPRNGEAVVMQSIAAMPDLQATIVHGQVPGGRAYSRSIHTDRSNNVVCEYWSIHGAGHAWSGGSERGSYTDPQGPNATLEMLRFFSKARLASA